MLKDQAGLRLAVRVTPKASRDRIVGWQGDVLKLCVTAVPERGKANQAVLRLLADTLELPTSALQVLRGQTGRDKLLAVDADPSVLRRLPPRETT